ncbi:hypothetical protein JCM6882_007555 [Rhodosporidiobolus microsporus]
MSSVAAVQQQLLDLLASLPPTTNPYLALSAFLKTRLYPDVPHSAVIQLYVLAGVLGLTALLVVISLLMRVRKGIFWIIRAQQSPRLLRPHATVSWAVIAVAMLALFEVLVAKEIAFFKGESDRNFGFWMLLVWGIAWWGGHTAAWSLAVSFLLHLHATNSRFPTHYFIPLTNFGGVGAPVIYAAIVLPLGVLGGVHYRNALDLLQQIDNLLLASASTWTPGTSFNILTLAPGLPILEKMEDEVASFVRWFRATFVFYALTAALLVIYLVIVAFLHLSSLRRILKETARELHSSNNFESLASTAPHRNRQQEQIQRTLQSLAQTILAFSLLGVFFCAISITAAVSPLSLVTSPTLAQAIVLGPLYAFSFFGLPSAILLVARARDANPSEESRASNSDGKDGSSGRKRSGGFGAAASQRGGRLGEAPTEFSIQLSSLPALNGQSPRRSQEEVDEKAVGGDRALSRWLSFGAGGKGHGSNSSTAATFSQSVSVHVDVDVAVEEDSDDFAKEKKEASFLHF